MTRHLGRPAAAVLTEAPFREWVGAKSLDPDLGTFDITFAVQGVDIVCDREERVQTVFLFNEKGRCFREDLEDLPFSCSRAEVLRRLGAPNKSGSAFTDKTLGPMGAWDRFARPGHLIHVQYRSDADRIGMITLMRADIAP